MNIEQEIPNVPVMRCATAGETLRIVLGRPMPSKIVTEAANRVGPRFAGAMENLLPGKKNKQMAEREVKLKAEREAKKKFLDEVLLLPLMEGYEDVSYARTMALVALEKNMKRGEFRQELFENGYFPASFSEGIAYLALRTARGKVVDDPVLHLGTFFPGDKCTEYRFLTKSNGDDDLIPFFAETELKQFHRIVVVKVEKHH